MNWSRSNWRDDIALPVIFSVLRAIWLVPWLELVRRWLAPSQAAPFLSPLIMVGVVLAGMAAARRALRTRALWRSRVWVVILGLATALLIVWWQFYAMAYWPWETSWLVTLGEQLAHWRNELPGPFVVFLVVAYLWLRGLLDGRQRLNTDHAWAAFAEGFLGLVLLLPAASLDSHGAPAGTSAYVLVFFAAALAALATSALQLARGPRLQGDEVLLGTARYWMLSVGMVIAGLLGLGVLLSYLIAPEMLAWVLSAANITLRLLGYVIYVLVVIISYPIFLLLGPLFDALGGDARPRDSSREIELPDFQRDLEELSRGAQRIQFRLPVDLRWIGLGVLLLSIAFIFVYVVRRFQHENEEQVEEARESIYSGDLLQEQLSALWQSWLGRRRRPPPPQSPYLALDGEPPTRRAIRAVYQALLAKASALGLPRQREQTPREYQLTLERHLPEAHDALSAITDSYLVARYAPEEPTSEQAEEARRAWGHLQNALAQPRDGRASERPPSPSGTQGAPSE